MEFDRVRPKSDVEHHLTFKDVLLMNHALTISIPRLHTDRLTLREYRVDDFALFADHLSNAESSAYLGSADRETECKRVALGNLLWRTVRGGLGGISGRDYLGSFWGGASVAWDCI